MSKSDELTKALVLLAVAAFCAAFAVDERESPLGAPPGFTSGLVAIYGADWVVRGVRN